MCCHIVAENYGWLRAVGSRTQRPGPSIGAETESGDITVQYRDWMRKNYGACLERLLQLLCHESSEVQVSFCCKDGRGSARCKVQGTKCVTKVCQYQPACGFAEQEGGGS